MLDLVGGMEFVSLDRGNGPHDGGCLGKVGESVAECHAGRWDLRHECCPCARALALHEILVRDMGICDDDEGNGPPSARGGRRRVLRDVEGLRPRVPGLFQDKGGFDGARRTRVFYCDSVKAGQKRAYEKSRMELQKIAPKGIGVERLTQRSVAVTCSHVSSYVRARCGLAPIASVHDPVRQPARQPRHLRRPARRRSDEAGPARAVTEKL